MLRQALRVVPQRSSQAIPPPAVLGAAARLPYVLLRLGCQSLWALRRVLVRAAAPGKDAARFEGGGCPLCLVGNCASSSSYKRTQETLSQAGQRTSAALSTMGSAISRKLGDMR